MYNYVDIVYARCHKQSDCLQRIVVIYSKSISPFARIEWQQTMINCTLFNGNLLDAYQQQK